MQEDKEQPAVREEEGVQKVIIHENPEENIGQESKALSPEELEKSQAQVEEEDRDSQFKQKERELEEKNKLLEEQKDKYLRLYAEFENFKKRKEEEKKTLLKTANEKILREVLTIMDSFDQAWASISEQERKESNVAKGLELIHKQLESLMSRHHITTIEAIGKHFDPHVHSAVMEESTDEYEPDTVAKELQKGYLFHGNVLRPTMVVVAKEK